MRRYRFWRSSMNSLGVNETLFGSLNDLDELHRTGPLMWHKPAPFGPPICFVMMPHPRQQRVVPVFMQDDANVLVDSHGPETGRRL
ncbi:hypothetical protein, partial [Chromohalobacter sp. HP20-39]|uniref:hypothetical protein n=1 Tax=Chromohalobacter sp. HP20-39 TaxID=3079306 RepID=UPI00294B90E0